jgi:phosphoribosyl 1,2-cyclic phosphodiesterase
MESLRITFWGVQGSIPVSLPKHSGDTTCVEIETSEGNIILLDAGSGIRRCALSIVDRWQNRADRTLHIFGSHEHLDHRIGLTFSRFCYVENNPFNLHLYGCYQFLQAIDQHYGVFSRQISELTYMDDPVDFTMMSAKFTGTEICTGRAGTPARHPSRRASDQIKRYWPTRDLTPIQIGKTTITPFEVYHVIPCCLGYKVEHEGKSFVFATDHELRRGAGNATGGEANAERQKRSEEAEAMLRTVSQNVDLAYVDGQYFVEEYLGKKGIGSFPAMRRVDWGHSCIEDVIVRAQQCNVKRTLIGHHDPERDWPQREEMDRQLALMCLGKPNQIQLADADLVVEL